MSTEIKIESKIKEMTDWIIKESGINGCIVGSSQIEADLSTWDSIPDIDIFVFNEASMVQAICTLMYKRGMKPGKYDSTATKGEAWKINKVLTEGINKKSALTTCSLYDGEVTVNVSYRKNQTSLIDVLSNFDMTIVMRGTDIHTGKVVDLRGENVKVATPNPFRKQDVDLWTVEKWVRQFDRVIKYWDRGFDTRPMAHFYIDLIDTVIKEGSYFQTEKATALYDQFVAEFTQIKSKIVTWLEDKEDN